MPVKLTTSEFIDRARVVHGDKYDYALSEYTSGDTKLKIECKTHGVFEQTPHNHLKPRNCPQCKKQTLSKAKLSNSKKFILSAKKIHGDKYDYGLVVYQGVKIPVFIHCKVHGVFEQNPITTCKGTAVISVLLSQE